MENIIEIIIPFFSPLVAAIIAVVFFRIGRTIFEVPYGPLVRSYIRGEERPRREEVSRAVFQTLSFYMMIAMVFIFTSGNIAGPLRQISESSTRTVVFWLSAGLFVAALTRVLTVTHSDFMIKNVIPIVLSFFGLALANSLSNLSAAEAFVHSSLRMISQPEFSRLLVGGAIVTAGGIESTLWLMRRVSARARKVPYELVRQYQEGFEIQRFATYRTPVTNLFKETIRHEILVNGLNHLYWKSFSVTQGVVEEILNTLAAKAAMDAGLGIFKDLPGVDKQRYVDLAWSRLEQLAQDGNARIIIPANRPEAWQRIKHTLRIDPATLPDVGIKRYMVINRMAAVIAFPVPPNEGTIRSLRSNTAISTTEVSRVHEILVEFDSQWLTATR